jgi:hypothetical protein
MGELKIRQYHMSNVLQKVNENDKEVNKLVQNKLNIQEY